MRECASACDEAHSIGFPVSTIRRATTAPLDVPTAHGNVRKDTHDQNKVVKQREACAQADETDLAKPGHSDSQASTDDVTSQNVPEDAADEQNDAESVDSVSSLPESVSFTPDHPFLTGSRYWTQCMLRNAVQISFLKARKGRSRSSSSSSSPTRNHSSCWHESEKQCMAQMHEPLPPSSMSQSLLASSWQDSSSAPLHEQHTWVAADYSEASAAEPSAKDDNACCADDTRSCRFSESRYTLTTHSEASECDEGDAGTDVGESLGSISEESFTDSVFTPKCIHQVGGVLRSTAEHSAQHEAQQKGSSSLNSYKSKHLLKSAMHASIPLAWNADSGLRGTRGRERSRTAQSLQHLTHALLKMHESHHMNEKVSRTICNVSEFVWGAPSATKLASTTKGASTNEGASRTASLPSTCPSKTDEAPNTESVTQHEGNSAKATSPGTRNVSVPSPSSRMTSAAEQSPNRSNSRLNFNSNLNSSSYADDDDSCPGMLNILSRKCSSTSSANFTAAVSHVLGNSGVPRPSDSSSACMSRRASVVSTQSLSNDTSAATTARTHDSHALDGPGNLTCRPASAKFKQHDAAFAKKFSEIEARRKSLGGSGKSTHTSKSADSGLPCMHSDIPQPLPPMSDLHSYDAALEKAKREAEEAAAHASRLSARVAHLVTERKLMHEAHASSLSAAARSITSSLSASLATYGSQQTVTHRPLHHVPSMHASNACGAQ